jgi:tetratricopeptide (TPR) repeat protein
MDDTNIELSAVRGLLDEVAAADPQARLHLYATTRVELRAEDLAECRRAHPDAGYWLSLRAEAGQPGQALPSRSEALIRLQAGEACLEDVASWLLTPGDEIVEPDSLIPLHQHALTVALRAEALLFVRRSCRALAVLSFLVADPEAPRNSLRRLTEDPRYRPAIAQWQALVDAVEGSAALRANPWIRVAAANFWTNSGTEVPARIDINPWLAAAIKVDPNPVLAALGEAKLMPFGGSLTDVLSLLIYEQLSAHPIVGHLRRIANYGGRIEELRGLDPPETLASWIFAAARRDQHETARLAAWLLHQHDQIPPNELCEFILRAPHAEDLPFLAEHAPNDKMREGIAGLAKAVSSLPDELADGMVQLFFLGPKHTRGLDRCHAHAEALREAAPGMAPPFCELAAVLLSFFDQIDQDVAGGAPSWTTIETRARELVEQCGEQPLDGAALDDLLSRAVIPQLDRRTITYATDAIDGLRPYERLFAAGLILRHLPPALVGMRDRFEECFAHAAVYSEALPLFPRAIAIIDGLLARHGGAKYDAADLIHFKALMVAAVAASAEERRDAALLHQQAATAARKSGLIRRQIHATTAWVRLVIIGIQLGDEWSRDLASDCTVALDALEDPAHEFDMLPELYEARAMLARETDDFVASARWYRDALRFTDPREHSVACADLHTNLAQTLLLTHDPQVVPEAEEHARMALRLLQDDSGVTSLALARAVLGMVLLRRSDEVSTEAIIHLEDALRVPRANRGITSVAQFRLSLADAYRRAGRSNEAETQLRRIFEESRDQQDLSLLINAVFLGVHLDSPNGHSDADARLQELIGRLGDSSERTLLQLCRALLFPSRYELSAVLLWAGAYVRRELPRNENVGRALIKFIDIDAPRLPHDFLELCLAADFVPPACWTARAKVFLTLGKKDLLLSLIEETLASDPKPELRRVALFYRIEVLPDSDPTIPATLLEVETLLEEGADAPYVRAQLAQRLYHRVGDGPSNLARAWRQIERATPMITRPDAHEDAWRLKAAIKAAQLTSLGPISGSEQIELARWFKQKLPLHVREVETMRLAVVRQLLFTGPLTSPDALALARYYLVRLTAPESEPLQRRLSWIHQEQAKPGPIEPIRFADDVPGRRDFDHVPGWVIDLVVRGLTDQRVALDVESFRWIWTGVRARPDRAEVLFVWLARQPMDALAELAPMIGSLCLDGNQRIGPSEFIAQLELALRQSPNFALRRLQVQLLASTGAWGDGSAYAAAADALLEEAETSEERAEAMFVKGVERLDASQEHGAASLEETDPIPQARQIFASAAELARSISLPAHLTFSIFSSAGNSHRHGSTPDPERALALYEEARAFGAPDAHSHAKLCKITADAFVIRDSTTDLERAEQLLVEALTIRTSGWLRAETLLSAARAALARDDRPWVSQLRKALHLLAEAQEHDDGRNSAAIAGFRRHVAKRLLAERPKDEEAVAVLTEIAGLVEDEGGERGMGLDALNQVTRSDLESIVGLFKDRSAADFINFARPLASVRGSRGEHDIGGVTEAVQATVAELDALGDDALSPGARLAKAQLLAYLAERGLAPPDAAMNAAARAEREIEPIEVLHVRAFLFSELAHFWSPENHWTHPVRDFQRAALLAERALAWVPSGHKLRHELVGYMARATRYRTDGDVRSHLLRAEQLYASLVSELEGGEPGLAEQIGVNLAEVRSALQHGDEKSHLRQSIAAAEHAIEAGGEQATMMNRIALARDRTLLGCRLPDPEGSRMLAAADAAWSALEWERMNKAQFESADNYRAICTAERCRRSGDLPGALAVWRARLDRLDRRLDPYGWAMAAHNYADNLARSDTEDYAGEAFRLAREVLEIRTANGDLLHHWETCQTLGEAAYVLLRRQAEDLVGLMTSALIELTVRYLQSSLDTAVRMGGGERRFKAAVRLTLVARFISGVSQRSKLLDQAWTHIDAARPFLLSDQDAASREAALAHDIALQFAEDLARQGPVGASPGMPFVFEGERARLVLPWILRGVGGAQRRLAARSHRPPAVEFEIWVRWTAAVQSGEPVEIGRCLELIRKRAPDFLSARPNLRGVEQWLETHDASAAVISVVTRRGLLTAVLMHGPQMKGMIALIAAPPPPASEPDIAASMNSGTLWSPQYKATLAWAHRCVIAPLTQLIGGELRSLLWCPPGVLRILAPANLWPGIAVTNVIDPCVRASGPERAWGQTALFVADPDVEGQRIPGSLEIACRLAVAAATHGGLRTRVSRGARFGAALSSAILGLVNAPADPKGFLDETLDAQLIILVAHGYVEPPLVAELSLIEADGRVTQLPLQTIAEDPRRIAGKTFVLLSCETARTGTWSHQAGGLAGALLACGARRLIAPLWPVLVDAAINLGEALLIGLAAGRDPAQVLLELVRGTGELTDGAAVSTCAFVVWSA